jgi:hypothetical protein
LGTRESLGDAGVELLRERPPGVHGPWIAYVQDVDVELPVGVAERISTRFEFARDEDAANLATVDAFVIAYHAVETFWRYVCAVLDGSGPVRAPLLSMAGLKAGKTFNDRITTHHELSDNEVDELLSVTYQASARHQSTRYSRTASRVGSLSQFASTSDGRKANASGATPTTRRSTASRSVLGRCNSPSSALAGAVRRSTS